MRGNNITDKTTSSGLICKSSLEKAIIAPDSIPLGFLGLGIDFEADVAVIVFTMRESQALKLLRQPFDTKLASFKLWQRVSLRVQRRAEMLNPVIIEVDVRRTNALCYLRTSRNSAGERRRRDFDLVEWTALKLLNPLNFLPHKRPCLPSLLEANLRENGVRMPCILRSERLIVALVCPMPVPNHEAVALSCRVVVSLCLFNH